VSANPSHCFWIDASHHVTYNTKNLCVCVCVCVGVHAYVYRSRYTVNKSKMILALNTHLNKKDVNSMRFGCLNPVTFWKVLSLWPKIWCKFYELFEMDAGIRPWKRTWHSTHPSQVFIESFSHVTSALG
jgi:hypothetical protein